MQIRDGSKTLFYTFILYKAHVLFVLSVYDSSKLDKGIVGVVWGMMGIRIDNEMYWKSKMMP